MEQEPNRQEPILTQHEQEELTLIERSIALSEGDFSLAFAIFENESQLDKVLAALAESVPNIQFIDIHDILADSMSDFVKKQLAIENPNDNPFSAIIYKGFENAADPYSGASPQRRFFSAAREMIERHSHCLVIFADIENNMGSWLSQSPDFYRYRSHSFNFTNEP